MGTDANDTKRPCYVYNSLRLCHYYYTYASSAAPQLSQQQFCLLCVRRQVRFLNISFYGSAYCYYLYSATAVRPGERTNRYSDELFIL